MNKTAEQPFIDFYTYPGVGEDDWRYSYETALIRALEIRMLSKATLLDMVNAEDFDQAADLIASSEYAIPHGSRNIPEVEIVLRHRRTAVRQLFAELMIDKPIVKLFKTRDDFANLRSAVRRALTDRPVESHYSNEGNVSPELFSEVFEEEDYKLFPDYMQEVTEQAVLAYYQKKDVRQIDYAIDKFQAQYNLQEAQKLNSIFLTNFFRIQIDLTNIRTMLRLKFTESEQQNVFLEGGFLSLERLRDALDTEYEAIGQLFFVMPHYRIVERGANYVAQNKSFLALEQQCEDYLTGFLKMTIQITAGPQPIIAHLLLKENEIRTVRLILTAKKNSLDTKLILDRLGE